MRIHENIHEAYLQALRQVLFRPRFVGVSPRGQETREIMNYSFTIEKPEIEFIKTFDTQRNKVIDSYSKKEFDLYESKTNKTEDFGKAAKFWKSIGNPDGTVNSAYGHLIWSKKSHGNLAMQFYDELAKQRDDIEAKDGVHEADLEYVKQMHESAFKTPWEWAKESLKADKDTRQAILRFSLPEHQWTGNKDQTCTMHGNFLIRNDRLHLSLVMRSNDLMKGLVYDLPWFISLMYKMRDELKLDYPDLEIGTYSHIVHSMHIYKPDYSRVLKMLGYREINLTDKGAETGNISISNGEYSKLLSEPGFFVKKDDNIYIVEDTYIRDKVVTQSQSYKVLNYSSGIKL